MTIQIVLICSIILAIVLGFITKINTGLYALLFSYIIGSFFLQIKPSAIIAMWPMNIFFILFSVTFFYNFTINNGTLEKLALNIIYKFGRYPAAFPFVIYGVATLISAMGAGFYTVAVMLCPLAFIIIGRTGMHPVLGVLAVMTGALSGGNLMTTATGSIIKQVIISAGYSAQGQSFALVVFLTSLVYNLATITILYFVLKGYKLSSATIAGFKKPEPFDQKQKLSLRMIIVFMIIVLLPYVLGIFYSNNPIITLFEKYMDVGFVSILFAIVAILLKVGSQKEALAKVPWNTIIMISGVGTLIALTAKAGTIEMLANLVGKSGSPILVIILISLISSIMAFFSSTVGVVIPTLYPVVAGITAATGLSPALLFSIINIGAFSAGMSPFSSGGAIALASTPNEEVTKKLYSQLFIYVSISVIFSMFAAVIMYFIFK